MEIERIKKLNKFAIPLLIQSITNIILSITDQLIIGRISISAFNSVNIISSFLAMIAGILGSITIIFNIKGGKVFGEKDKEKFQFEFITSVLLSTILGIVFILIVFLGREIFLKDIYKLSEESIRDGIIYTNSMSFYVLLQLYLFSFGTYFRIKNNTKWILIGSVLSSIFNLVIDYIFVLGKFGMPKLGINIAGVSTILAMILNLSIYIFIVRKDIINIKIKNIFKNSIVHLKSSIPLMLQEILEGTIFVTIINMIIARIGENELGGYFIITNLLGFVNLFKYVYGSANLTLTSISLGNKNIDDLKNYPKLTSIIIFLLSATMSYILILKKDFALNLILKDNIVAVDISKKYLFVFLLGSIVSSISYSYRNSLYGLSESKFILYSNFIVNIIIMIFMLLMVKYLNFSLYGIGLSIIINEIFLGLIYYKKYNKIIKNIFK